LTPKLKNAAREAKTYHDKRCNDPVDHNAETELYPNLAVGEEMV
jgi:hypothetical protein